LAYQNSMKGRGRLCLLVLVASLTGAGPFVPSARAASGATYTWTGGGGTSNKNWSDAANWSCSPSPNCQASTPNPIDQQQSDVVFPAGPTQPDSNIDAGTAPVEVNSLTIQSSSYSISSTDGSGLKVDSTASLQGQIDVSTGFAGSNQLYLGAVTLVGDTTLTCAGQVDFFSTVDGAFSLDVSSFLKSFAGRVGGSAALTSLTTDAGPTHLNGGGVTTSGAQSYQGAVSLGANATLTSTGSGDVTFGSTVDGSFSLAVNTGGLTAFGGQVGGSTKPTSLTTDAFGSTALNGGGVATTGAQTYNDVISLGADTTLRSTSGSIGSSAAIGLSSHTLTVVGSGSLSGVISGSGGVIKQGSGTLVLGGTNTFTGTTDITGGLVNFRSLSNLGLGSVTLDGGGLQWASGTSTDVSPRLSALGGNGGTLDTNGNNVTLATEIDGAGALTKTGSGTLTLTAANTYSGETTINAGTLALTGTIAGNVIVNSGGTLNISGSGFVEGTITNNSGTVTGTAPGAPTGVSGSLGDGQVTVSFTAPGSAGSSSITSYTVTASPGGATASGSSSPITVSGLTNGTSYTFTVQATNGVGTGSASSASSAVVPGAVPDAPTSVSAVAGNRKATVSFTAPSSNGSTITSYTVTASPGGATGSGSSSPITVSGLTNGTSYTFTVTATNGVGTGPASASSSPVTPVGSGGGGSGGSSGTSGGTTPKPPPAVVPDTQAPSAPSHLNGHFAGGTLALSWQASNDNVAVDHYEIDLNGSAIERIPAGTTRASIRTFRPKGTSLFTVRALDAAGNASGTVGPVTVRPIARPTIAPKRIPAWAWELFAWEQHGGKGKRPRTPAPLPHWYGAWKAWRIEPFAVVT